MDVIFDIDGTLANAEHRLHYILDPNHFVAPNGNPLVPRKPDWDRFLSDEEVAKDGPIPQTWYILDSMFCMDRCYRLLFITGRPERTRDMTINWLAQQMFDQDLIRSKNRLGRFKKTPLYMRTDGDRRPSHEVKEELLIQARKDGFNPTLVFEDRNDDTAMWRRNGLLCCQVADGDY